MSSITPMMRVICSELFSIPCIASTACPTTCAPLCAPLRFCWLASSAPCGAFGGGPHADGQLVERGRRFLKRGGLRLGPARQIAAGLRDRLGTVPHAFRDRVDARQARCRPGRSPRCNSRAAFRRLRETGSSEGCRSAGSGHRPPTGTAPPSIIDHAPGRGRSRSFSASCSSASAARRAPSARSLRNSEMARMIRGRPHPRSGGAEAPSKSLRAIADRTSRGLDRGRKSHQSAAATTDKTDSRATGPTMTPCLA
jgi:hypothetical protein